MFKQNASHRKQKEGSLEHSDWRIKIDLNFFLFNILGKTRLLINLQRHPIRESGLIVCVVFSASEVLQFPDARVNHKLVFIDHVVKLKFQIHLLVFHHHIFNVNFATALASGQISLISQVIFLLEIIVVLRI